MSSENLLHFSAMSIALHTSEFQLYSQGTFPQVPNSGCGSSGPFIFTPHHAEDRELGGGGGGAGEWSVSFPIGVVRFILIGPA